MPTYWLKNTCLHWLSSLCIAGSTMALPYSDGILVSDFSDTCISIYNYRYWINFLIFFIVIYFYTSLNLHSKLSGIFEFVRSVLNFTKFIACRFSASSFHSYVFMCLHVSYVAFRKICILPTGLKNVNSKHFCELKWG